MAVGQLRARLRRRLEDEQRMCERVIADDVSRLDHRGRNIRTLPHVAADHEERCPHTVLDQDIKQPQRVRIVRPVIVGERDLLASPHPSSDRPPIPLPGRRHGLISRRRSSSSGRHSEKSWKHDRIVTEVRGQRSDCRGETNASWFWSLPLQSDLSPLTFPQSTIASRREAIYSAFQFSTNNPWPSFSSFPVTLRSRVPYALGRARWRGFLESAWLPSASSNRKTTHFLRRSTKASAAQPSRHSWRS